MYEGAWGHLEQSKSLLMKHGASLDACYITVRGSCLAFKVAGSENVGPQSGFHITPQG